MQWDKSERNTSEKSTLQTSPNWRVNLPKLEGALFQGLVAWRIIFFYFQNHFLKIHTRGIPKMSDFYVFSHLWLRKRLSKKKKRVLPPSFPQPTSSSKWVGEPDYPAWTLSSSDAPYVPSLFLSGKFAAPSLCPKMLVVNGHLCQVCFTLIRYLSLRQLGFTATLWSYVDLAGLLQTL